MIKEGHKSCLPSFSTPDWIVVDLDTVLFIFKEICILNYLTIQLSFQIFSNFIVLKKVKRKSKYGYLYGIFHQMWSTSTVYFIEMWSISTVHFVQIWGICTVDLNKMCGTSMIHLIKMRGISTIHFIEM